MENRKFRVPTFRKAAKEIILLHRLMKSIQSYDRSVVEASLQRLFNRVTSPGKGCILLDMGVCDVLLSLPALASSKREQIVILILKIISSFAMTGKSFLRIATNRDFCSLMFDMLDWKAPGRSVVRKPHEQKLAGKIVCNMFRQLPPEESILFGNEDTVKLLILALHLPYVSSVLSALTIINELTYHCDHVRILLTSFGVDNEFCFLSALEELIISEHKDLQFLAIQVLLNCLSFIHHPQIRSEILHHSLCFEHCLIMQYQDDLDVINDMQGGVRDTLIQSKDRDSRVSGIKRSSNFRSRLGSNVSLKTALSGSVMAATLKVDIALVRRIPRPMRLLNVLRRNEIVFEILWILCALHGKLRVPSRNGGTSSIIRLCPGDTFEKLADLLQNVDI